jgi:hypothetical protein
MGSRVITEVSNIMFEEFAKNFQARLKQAAHAISGQGSTEESKPINASALAWEAAKGLFRGKS